MNKNLAKLIAIKLIVPIAIVTVAVVIANELDKRTPAAIEN